MHLFVSVGFSWCLDLMCVGDALTRPASGLSKLYLFLSALLNMLANGTVLVHGSLTKTI